MKSQRNMKKIVDPSYKSLQSAISKHTPGIYPAESSTFSDPNLYTLAKLRHTKSQRDFMIWIFFEKMFL